MMQPGAGDAPKANILLVDDDASILETSSMMLEMLGYKVTAVTSGKAALEALGSTQFDLMFTDLDMPGMDGRTLAKEARATGAATKLIVVSGYYLEDEDWQNDFDGMLMKPFRIQDLQEKVNELLAS